jgi:hypothetical protein
MLALKETIVLRRGFVNEADAVSPYVRMDPYSSYAFGMKGM